jgi:hypothetical protein
MMGTREKDQWRSDLLEEAIEWGLDFGLDAILDILSGLF